VFSFTPTRSTIDCILALRVLNERRREFRQGLLAAYFDLCNVFDSVNQDALCRILGLRGMPPKLINLMSELYSGTEGAVRCGDSISDLFLVVTGIRQGCILTLKLFSTCMDWILQRMSERSNCGASFGNVKISDLDFADDAVICLFVCWVVDLSPLIVRFSVVMSVCLSVCLSRPVLR